MVIAIELNSWELLPTLNYSNKFLIIVITRVSQKNDAVCWINVSVHLEDTKWWMPGFWNILLGCYSSGFWYLSQMSGNFVILFLFHLFSRRLFFLLYHGYGRVLAFESNDMWEFWWWYFCLPFVSKKYLFPTIMDIAGVKAGFWFIRLLFFMLS